MYSPTKSELDYYYYIITNHKLQNLENGIASTYNDKLFLLNYNCMSSPSILINNNKNYFSEIIVPYIIFFAQLPNIKVISNPNFIYNNRLFTAIRHRITDDWVKQFLTRNSLIYKENKRYLFIEKMKNQCSDIRDNIQTLFIYEVSIINSIIPNDNEPKGLMWRIAY